LSTLPGYTIANGDTLEVTDGTTFAAYIPPSEAYPTLSAAGGIRWRYEGMSVDNEFIDGNTLRLTVGGNVGDGAEFTYYVSQGFTVRLVDEVAPPDLCPNDDVKTEPGVCGCGTSDADTNNDGIADCQQAPEDLLAPADIDGNGMVERDRDGLLLLRYLFGFRGPTLIGNVTDTQNCLRCNVEAVQTYLNDHRDQFDIDGNGHASALSDGILIIRYIAGYDGDALTAHAVDRLACTRCGNAAIAAYLQGLL